MSDQEIKDVLERIEQDGSDMSKPMGFEFIAASDDRKSLYELIEILSDDFNLNQFEFDEEEQEWLLVCLLHIIPSVVILKKLESDFISSCTKARCEYAGFGSFGNVSDEK